jgi:ATP-dependent helicase Lhr and Lhr-like helicase
VTSFDQLHPALQHHIVNSLAWRVLRPLQRRGIPPILAGQHALLVAPTAGGKTEAAFFPVLSRMLSSDWTGLSVIYLCPIKALLNNLDLRLSGYCDLVGRRSAVWHGDIRDSEKRRFLTEPFDCLLTTPESLELMLVSTRTDKINLFKNLQVVIVDEIHAFAGDDRGWHLLALLERLTKIAGREIQRIGLSATVGNPERLLKWLCGHCQGSGLVIAPENSIAADAKVEIDYVGNLENAAIVLSRLYRGEKRLVFCDSRSRTEQLTARLRALGVPTFVSHSSLSADERKSAEDAFSTGSDCIIVATSTMELGIDVGDLDRVIQIDAPVTVSSFLQRMGRTGRRKGSTRNCLFLTTSRPTLIQAAGLIELWRSGYVEPIEPTEMPFHLFAQQMMALALQQRGIGTDAWREWIGRVPAFATMRTDQTRSIIAHMLANGLFTEDEGLLWFGQAGEAEFGRKNFMDILSVFQSPPLFTVKYGLSELGQVHESSFMIRTGDRPVLLLGGRNWVATNIDWSKRIAHVEPTERQGKSRWVGSGQPLSFPHCQAIKSVLRSGSTSKHYSHRALEEITDASTEFAWLSDECTTVAVDRSAGRTFWWTFAGLRANAMLAETIRERLGVASTVDNLVITMNRALDQDAFDELLHVLRGCSQLVPALADIDKAIDGLKFSTCLPPALAREMMASRLTDTSAVTHVLQRSTRHLLM